MSSEFKENNYSSKMSKSVESYKKDISSLRTGELMLQCLIQSKLMFMGN